MDQRSLFLAPEATSLVSVVSFAESSVLISTSITNACGDPHLLVVERLAANHHMHVARLRAKDVTLPNCFGFQVNLQK